ncbi:spore germination protein [Alicyclobacillus mengziensis]|uniref:Spore germination protein n=1 Tax=Alicyclobacillus mengziensis TaxID=2931921 RepID=A0A9X7VXI4_9BACL|nr:spore germination protein [Alicyclobacillus mengziensis]QSO45839.1 spore germination protein [Alicyclobacillus mengziensis]QSO46630.1 spore germination protein [Alicyclobacillus mengziensis]
MRRKRTELNFRAGATSKHVRVWTSDTPFLQERGEDKEFPSDIAKVLSLIEDRWASCADVQYRHLHVEGIRVTLVFIAGLVDEDMAQRGVIGPLTRYSTGAVTVDNLRDTLWTTKTDETGELSAVYRAIADGKMVLLIDGQSRALVVDVNRDPERPIERSQNEPAIQGPQEAFIENMQTNIALIRKRLRTSKLKVEFMRLGTYTETPIALVYINGIVKPGYLDEARSRLGRIDIDGIIATNQVRELIADSARSPFRLTEVTERPDRVVAGLLQGRLYIFINGSPNVIAVPSIFVNGLIASEDYYGHYMIAFPLRILRHVMYWASLLLPSLYIALLSYNQDLVPTPLLISLESQHEGIPFPTVVEALVMQTAFEALREAGLRLPRAVGQSVSIVGALVIGDAAVNANIVSPGMVIVVATAGVASYTIPSQDLVNANRILQYPFMIAASVLGLFGIASLGLVLVIHMLSLRSFGVPFMAPLAPFSWPDLRDTFIRAPWWAMNQRPQVYEPVDSVRNRSPMPSPPSGDSQ